MLAKSERGQAILMFVGVFSVILVVAAIVIDFGLWWAERRTAQRAADLAAAAGAQDLPDDVSAAFASACRWAAANGYASDTVDVEIFTRGTPEPPAACDGGAPAPGCGAQCDTLRVTVGDSAPRLFTALPLFGIDDVTVGAVAAAGLTSGGGGAGGAGPDQTVLLIDAQGWMGNGCNRHPATCAMGRVRTEAGSFVDTVAGGAGAQVGYAPYTHCYHPDLPNNYPCVSRTILVDPTNAVGDLDAAIAATQPISLAHANLCLPLLEARNMFDRVPSGGRRAVVLLSNGDNRYNHTTWWNDFLDYPPGPCRPSPYDETFNNAYGPCEPWPVPEERVLDRLTLAMANQLKAEGIDIFVVGLDVCGPDDGLNQDSQGYCNSIGDGAPDTTSDQRLLKCVASSPEHYQSVDIAGIPGAFQEIASEVVSRSLLQ